ncbi:VOC family protein [Subtercola endophyticus]|uniref:VOC family protein n=1 Tax=Subtercola endophyticus TaxID=2895559 RepID=UPI001E365666|nr:VOC family protein [Subtercola endophyticus]UFS58450.1 VOC family protein [Subtercola endophyticus]
MIGVIDEVVFDCADPRALATFWAGILGGEPTGRDDAWWYILPPGFSQVSFQKVPEAKTVKNRVHLDVRVDDLGPAITEAERLGALRTGGIHSDTAGSFQVLLDPEGNEWCLVVPTAVPPSAHL